MSEGMVRTRYHYGRGIIAQLHQPPQEYWHVGNFTFLKRKVMLELPLAALRVASRARNKRTRNK